MLKGLTQKVQHSESFCIHMHASGDNRWYVMEETMQVWMMKDVTSEEFGGFIKLI